MPMRSSSVASRLAQRLGASPRFARIAPAIVPRVDRFLSRVTGGRWLSSSGVVPSIVLLTIGARSGQERETPLATVLDGDDFYVVGSNWGKPHHPAWSHNLLANPDATVVHRGRRIPVVAELLDADEKAAEWPNLTAIWPAYDAYEARTARDLRVFRLRPATQ
jgi:deazaflavin-dependent oxidoreductase (nitroreductase family)